MGKETIFCPQCRCEFPAWVLKCPRCKTPLIEELPPAPERIEKTISYEEVTLVRKNGGQLQIDVRTVDVGMDKKWRFPYFGYGFALARRMQRHIGGNEVTLTATKVSMERKWEFPYLGYGYAWTQEMSGECGSQLRIDFVTTDVGREKKWRFPYQGYGFAWAQKGILTVTLKE